MVEAAQRAIAAGETQFEVEFRVVRPDGAVRWLLLRAEVLFSESDTMSKAIGVVMDIDERKRAEERQDLLLRELNHRVKNSLAVIQAIAWLTFREDRADPSALKEFQGRLAALSEANDIVLSRDWQPFSLRTLLVKLTEPYGPVPDNIRIEGEDVLLPPRLNVPLALAIHELATNAAKYGALSTPQGKVKITISSEGPRYSITWSEDGGPPVLSAYKESFGTKLIRRVLANESGRVDLMFQSTGVICAISGQYRDP